jgi:hypothetical protein
MKRTGVCRAIAGAVTSHIAGKAFPSHNTGPQPHCRAVLHPRKLTASKRSSLPAGTDPLGRAAWRTLQSVPDISPSFRKLAW